LQFNKSIGYYQFYIFIAVLRTMFSVYNITSLGKINTTEKKLTDLWEFLHKNDAYETNVNDYDIVDIRKLGINNHHRGSFNQ